MGDTELSEGAAIGKCYNWDGKQVHKDPIEARHCHGNRPEKSGNEEGIDPWGQLRGMGLGSCRMGRVEARAAPGWHRAALRVTLGVPLLTRVGTTKSHRHLPAQGDRLAEQTGPARTANFTTFQPQPGAFQG